MKNNKSGLMARIAATLVVSGTLAACNFSEAPSTISALKMQLSDYEVTMMVGDTLSLECRFEPDSVTAPKAFWYKYSPNVELDNPSGWVCQVIGTQPGDAWVYAVTLNDNLRDSCLVHVQPMWDTFRPIGYEFDMIVYADVEIDGKHNDPRYTIASFLSYQVRGIGEIVDTKGVTCTAIRVWHHRPEGAEFSFRYYDNVLRRSGDLDLKLIFDGEAHGTPTSPIIVKAVPQGPRPDDEQKPDTETDTDTDTDTDTETDSDTADQETSPEIE